MKNRFGPPIVEAKFGKMSLKTDNNFFEVPLVSVRIVKGRGAARILRRGGPESRGAR